jgi:hypothetical protein
MRMNMAIYRGSFDDKGVNDHERSQRLVVLKIGRERKGFVV